MDEQITEILHNPLATKFTTIFIGVMIIKFTSATFHLVEAPEFKMKAGK